MIPKAEDSQNYQPHKSLHPLNILYLDTCRTQALAASPSRLLRQLDSPFRAAARLPKTPATEGRRLGGNASPSALKLCLSAIEPTYGRLLYLAGNLTNFRWDLSSAVCSMLITVGIDMDSLGLSLKLIFENLDG